MLPNQTRNRTHTRLEADAVPTPTEEFDPMTTVHSEQWREIELLQRLRQADAARLDERFADCPMPEENLFLLGRRLLPDVFDLSGMKRGLRNFLPREPRSHLLEINANGSRKANAEKILLITIMDKASNRTTLNCCKIYSTSIASPTERKNKQRKNTW